MAKVLLAVFILAACGKGDAPPDPKQLKTAKLAVEKLAFEEYPMWARDHPELACPASIDDLAKGAKDAWGNPYKMFCGANLPPGARGLAILSFGPDGKEGTPDDIKSWEK
jgi:hypothetical protein